MVEAMESDRMARDVQAVSPAPLERASPPPPAPALPEQMNRRPRRVRRTGTGFCHPPDTAPMQVHSLLVDGKPTPVHTLPLLPPAGEPGRRKEKKLRPALGFEYGPRFTCPVDTLLTVLFFVLTKHEKKAWRREVPLAGFDILGDALERKHAVARATEAWRNLLRALKLHKRGKSAPAKRLWYECMVRQQKDLNESVKDVSPDQMSNHRAIKHTAEWVECRCQCQCENCAAGKCSACPTCGCDIHRLMGHCFGLAEQIFNHLAPDGISSSPFHLCTRPVWCCDHCTYRFTAHAPQAHVPLMLTVADIDALLASRVPPEVGALVAAHLHSNRYDYGQCPQCGKGQLLFRPDVLNFPALLLVELGRPLCNDAGARTDRLPWRLALEPEMTLHMPMRLSAEKIASDVLGESQPVIYDAVAVVYNDASHWWAEVLSRTHFRKDAHGQQGSYRYDGLEARGALRYIGKGPVLARTSEPRYMSLVWYRARRRH